ncbi:hypothetical protein F66182_8559 [Fusarium sp. NRRL 66182]|nr:hypothetical protein F66182_8559 [Fusarium sp. NRRL 66182]
MTLSLQRDTSRPNGHVDTHSRGEDNKVIEMTTYGAHGVIVTAASRAAYESAPSYLGPNGTIVAVGLPQDPSVIADVEEALDFTVRGLVHPILSKGKLEDLDEWIHKLANGLVAGRCVLKVAT